MSTQLYVDELIRAFTYQAGRFGRVFADDPISSDPSPERQRAIDAFKRIKIDGDGEADIFQARIQIKLSLTELALDSINDVPPSGKIAKFLRALKNETEVEVGKMVLEFGKGGAVLSTSKSKAELYGNWSVAAKIESAETVMDFIGSLKVGFVK